MARAAVRQILGPAPIAASLSVITALALRYILNIPMPAELFAEQATVRIPLPLFEGLLTTFGTAAKHLYLIGALVVEAGLTVLAGLAYVALRALTLRRAGRTAAAETLAWLDLPILVVWLWALSAVLLAPLLGGGLFGMGLSGGALATFSTQLAPDLVFGLALVWQSREAHRIREEDGAGDAIATLSRRALFQQGATGVGILAVGIGLWEALTSGLGAALGAGPLQGSSPPLTVGMIPKQIIPPPTPTYGPWTPVPGLVPEITPASSFYYVSKNIAADPNVATGSWSLAIGGNVDRPYSLSYDQLRALPSLTQYHTLECISNEVGGSLMSNGLFVGVRLADLLNTAGVQAGASTLTFTAADGYSDTLHLAQAMDERSLVVYLLDGAPLPQPHGFPARLLIPGLYGMKNGKWLTDLSVSDTYPDGYWEQRGWTSVASVKLMSRIDTPHDGDLLVARPTSIAGVAYSGANGISRVDVSVDGGRSWSPANLRRPLGALTWTLWEYPWTPDSGATVIAVRAIDLAGNVQQPTIAPPLPDGASGYHAVSVTVR